MVTLQIQKSSSKTLKIQIYCNIDHCPKDFGKNLEKFFFAYIKHFSKSLFQKCPQNTLSYYESSGFERPAL